MKRIEKEIMDYETVDKCHNCCICCDKYKTSKEQKNCEVRKARGRIINRNIYKQKKLKGSK